MDKVAAGDDTDSGAVLEAPASDGEEDESACTLRQKGSCYSKESTDRL